MKVSREQMKANRARILDVASRLFREKGFEVVSVSEVMKAAGLTHGGFYGHFSSKDDLIAKTIAHVFGPDGNVRGGEGGSLNDYLDLYLSASHRDGVAEGCPTAALVADGRRQSVEARCALTEGLRSQFDRMTGAMKTSNSAGARRQAVGAWASMVGALVLSRSVEDPALSDEILSETRAWIDERLGALPVEAAEPSAG